MMVSTDKNIMSTNKFLMVSALAKKKNCAKNGLSMMHIFDTLKKNTSGTKTHITAIALSDQTYNSLFCLLTLVNVTPRYLN